jgi:hypothetical protein
MKGGNPRGGVWWDKEKKGTDLLEKKGDEKRGQIYYSTLN